MASSVRSLVTPTEHRLKHFVTTQDLGIRKIYVYLRNQQWRTNTYTEKEIEQASEYFLVNPTKTWFLRNGDGFKEGLLSIHRESVFGYEPTYDLD